MLTRQSGSACITRRTWPMTVMELGTPPVEAPAERPRKLPLKETGREESVDRRLSTVGASALPPET